MAKNKFNKTWLNEHLTDPYVRMAREKGYRSRAAFKLIQLLEQDRFIRPGMVVVELGAAPGSWSQVLREQMLDGPGSLKGRIIALDMLPMEPIDGVEFLQGDFRELEVLEQLQALVAGQPVDAVVSDMAPNLSGIEIADAARMLDVGELAIDFACQHLKPEGYLLLKSFHGSQYSQLVHMLKLKFKTVAPRKPKASRDRSSETFLLACGLK